MTRLTWDQIGDRRFEAGVDRGVLYLDDGTGIPWNGLTAVSESFDSDVSSYYLDGVKYLDRRSLNDFSASIKAFTYPDEFMQFDGISQVWQGFYAADQPVSSTFGLSYRTGIGDDIQGLDLGYKIHLLYNLTMKPDNREFVTQSNDTNVNEFSWSVVGTPEPILGFRPTAHLIIDSRYFNAYQLAALEDILYGTDDDPATLMTPQDFVDYLTTFHAITVVDNGDSTWTVTGPDDLVRMTSGTLFQIDGIDATYLDATTYEIPTTS